VDFNCYIMVIFKDMIAEDYLGIGKGKAGG
jgi:hypothetical protein